MMNTRLVPALCIVSTIAMCDRAKNATTASSGDSSAAAQQANSSSASGDERDPCTLVTQAEAEKWLGPLAHAPFRSTSGGMPNADGGYCKYLATDGRYIIMEPSWTNGSAGMAAIKMGGSLAGKVFTENNGQTDTLEGSWDEARWLMGAFYALKGEYLIETNVRSSRAGVPGAADLSSKAIDRFSKPLDYNGTKAAADAPRPRETGDPCALLTAAEIAAVVGPVEGTPTATGRGTNTSCHYQVRVKGVVTELRLDVSWNQGFENFAGQKLVANTVMQQQAGAQGAKGETGKGVKAEAMKPSDAPKDPEMEKMMGALQGLAKTQGIQMNKSGGLVHDTLIAGPWAEGAILAGSAFVAVKNDVQVWMESRAMDMDQAKALMVKVMARL